MWTSRYPPAEKSGAIACKRRCASCGNHHCDIYRTIADWSDSGVSILFNVHLAVAGHILDALVVRYESQTPGKACSASKTKPTRYHRAESVRRDNQRCGPLAIRSVFDKRADAAHAAARIANNVSHSHPFFDTGASGARAIEKAGVENGSANCHTAIAVTAPTVRRNEISLEGGAVRRSDSHP